MELQDECTLKELCKTQPGIIFLELRNLESDTSIIDVILFERVIILYRSLAKEGPGECTLL